MALTCCTSGGAWKSDVALEASSSALRDLHRIADIGDPPLQVVPHFMDVFPPTLQNKRHLSIKQLSYYGLPWCQGALCVVSLFNHAIQEAFDFDLSLL